MKRSSVSTLVYVLLLFLSGALVGVFAQRLYQASSVKANQDQADRYRRGYLAEMKERLSLTAEQGARLQVVLDDTKRQYHDLQQRTRPEMKAIEKEHVQKVQSVLTDAQRIEYQKMRKERDDRRRRGDSPKRRDDGC